MKKIISFIIAVLMLCALCVPAFAESVSMVVTPTKDSDGNYEIVLTEPGNYFITKSCEVYLFFVRNCTLTIAEGVTVTVTNSGNNIDGVLNIGSGAVLELSGTDFANDGTMNVHGTVDISTRRGCSNMFSGTINIYTDGSLNGSDNIDNLGTIIDGLDCQEDHTVCNHAFADNHICTKCGYVNAELHEHDYTTGLMTGRCACGEACPHAELDNGFCTACDYFDLSQHTHDFTSGTCKCGKTVCDVNGHTLNNGFCTVCDYFDPSQHTHDFTSGTCKCGKACPHENWTDGVCDDCGHVCTHEGEFCGTCGKVLTTVSEPTPTDTELTASVFSEGNMTVVLCIACAVVFGLGGFILGKKKKPALANRTSGEDDE